MFYILLVVIIIIILYDEVMLDSVLLPMSAASMNLFNRRLKDVIKEAAMTFGD